MRHKQPKTLCDITDELEIIGPSKINVQFGNTDKSGYTDVKDVTQIQLALANKTN